MSASKFSLSAVSGFSLLSNCNTSQPQAFSTFCNYRSFSASKIKDRTIMMLPKQAASAEAVLARPGRC